MITSWLTIAVSFLIAHRKCNGDPESKLWEQAMSCMKDGVRRDRAAHATLWGVELFRPKYTPYPNYASLSSLRNVGNPASPSAPGHKIIRQY